MALETFGIFGLEVCQLASALDLRTEIVFYYLHLYVDLSFLHILA